MRISKMDKKGEWRPIEPYQGDSLRVVEVDSYSITLETYMIDRHGDTHMYRVYLTRNEFEAAAKAAQGSK